MPDFNHSLIVRRHDTHGRVTFDMTVRSVHHKHDEAVAYALAASIVIDATDVVTIVDPSTDRVLVEISRGER